MRIGIVISELGLGGAERVVLDLAGALPRYGCSMTILPLSSNGVLRSAAEEIARVVPIDHGRGDPRIVGALAREIRRAGIDILHLHLPRAAVVGRLAARAVQFRPVVYTEHNVWSGYGWAIRKLNQWTLPWTDHIIAVSDQVRECLLTHGVPSGLLTTIRNGIDIEGIRARAARGSSLKTELGLAPEMPVIGSVANLHPRKALHTLIGALARLRSRFPKVHAVVIGRDDGDGVRLKRLAAQLGVSRAVSFLGPRSDAVALMREFDVFVLSSRVEGLPIALLEAMALRRPIVATVVGGIPEVIGDGRHGLLVPPESVEAVAAAIEKLLLAPSAAAAMGEAAGERVAILCSLDGAAQQHAALYRRLLESPPQSRPAAG